ncbi:MAG TPA: SAM-dependent methyltransferase, partial [Usitatibacter sp.]
ARIFGGLRQALAPGGLLILQGYRPEQIAYGTGGPSQVENLYTEELLRESFAGLEILHLASHDDAVDEGPGHRGMSALIELVARQR